MTEVAQRQRRLATVDVPAFRESLAAELVTAIETFKSKVAGLRYPLGEEFRRAADAWLVVARRQQEEARRVLETAPAAQVFRAGDPVDKEREAFVPRLALIAELQGQITLATGCPGLLLYGRRRMGKSTLIRNAEPFLPATVRVARLSMQDPGAFGSLEGLLATIVERACEAAGVPAGGEPEGLAAFYRRLGEVDAALAAAERRLVLAIDEYENIDAKIGEGVFPRDLLATFRESVQSHRRIVWLFAGSHAIEELAADWSSAFVSLRTVEVTPFSEAETRLLLTEPLARSGLWAEGRPAAAAVRARVLGRGRDRAHPRRDGGLAAPGPARGRDGGGAGEPAGAEGGVAGAARGGAGEGGGARGRGAAAAGAERVRGRGRVGVPRGVPGGGGAAGADGRARAAVAAAAAAGGGGRRGLADAGAADAALADRAGVAAAGSAYAAALTGAC